MIIAGVDFSLDSTGIYKWNEDTKKYSPHLISPGKRKGLPRIKYDAEQISKAIHTIITRLK